MVDDSYYITPHETALAVVATAMKKARLQLDTLVVNSLVGGVLFSTGGMLYLAGHSDSPGMMASAPGLANLLGAATFVLGLFFVVINGADLFNSNILFFSVALLRRAVSIYDLLVSWIVSWFCNLAGTLFVCYVICHLSGATASESWVENSRVIVASKVSHSFVQILIRGMAGNFYVCLAIYLQLMVKPLHVKLIVMSLPIFTFVSMGFTHVIADMYLVMMGMINGADLTVARCIWAVFIPGTLGNIIGGFAFGAIVPFYLHLIVVERDRKKLSLPEYDARDEQPELNIDSRVVRVPKEQAQDKGVTDLLSAYYPDEQLHAMPDSEARSQSMPVVSRTTTRRSHASSFAAPSAAATRSPPGVFPVRGMARPLTRERHIANAADDSAPYLALDSSSTTSSLRSSSDSTQPPTAARRRHSLPGTLWESPDQEEAQYLYDGGYDVRGHTLGSRLERALTWITSPARLPSPEPFVAEKAAPGSPRARRASFASRFRSFGRAFMPSRDPDDIHTIHRKLSEAGVTAVAADASDNIAGVVNYDGIALPANNSPFYRTQPQLRPVVPLAARPSFETAAARSSKRLSQLRNMVSFDNDDFEEQSIREPR
ncbi:AGL077Wp [Eremothecium gossypii ATCC 10895]|uniref:AGL077Wp n=1 Tax=Eremothecium gossypii (strain ATCC 10895 / CBS 109.51 / FGSC 9923 / NRRL Y-1056) TaxID=284811 RepID=Q751A0_EREGS|nr:AGL077Wp [Eremothecium gossypii ATCC 10895]AAS54413.2 AGL077Wp [Eremothecium gossypii ATCC 10895]AEY98741.1 FAGL077Wp [Eremothecium gossypii FDAG1]